MGQDQLRAYEEAVDSLVKLIEVFPEEEARYDIGDAQAGNLLLSVADVYAGRGNEVFDSLIEQIADEADIDRILALAAGDFRLAASLVAVDDYWSEGDAVDVERSAQQEEERSALRDELVRTTFKGLADKGAQRANAVSLIEDQYRKNKFPVTYCRFAVRAFRLARAQHFAPPQSEIAMGCAILGLCGISGWIAQDSLDHPPVSFAPNLRRGVRSAV
jgi:hypothetical protein